MKQQLYGHTFKTSKWDKQDMWDTARESRMDLWVKFLYGPLHMDIPVLANQQELTYNTPVWTQGIVWKTCQKLWMMGTNGERESGKSMLAPQLDEADI